MNQVYSFTLKGCNSTKRISYLLILRERTELAIQKSNFLQEDRMRNLQDIEELKKLCCTEAERAKQLRIDELSIQKKSLSSVNQLTAQIHELQSEFPERF